MVLKPCYSLPSFKPLVNKTDISNWFCSLENNSCAAGFALLNLPKGKSLGRSKPATNSSNEQAH